MNYGVVFAILSAFFYGLMSVVDKFIISKKVKNIYAYMPVAGIVNFFYTLCVGFFLDWSNFNVGYIIYPGIIGFFIFIQFYFYARTLEKEDVSHAIGLLYSYPLIVALLSFFILNERLPLVGYIGLFLIIAGSFFLFGRLTKESFGKRMLNIFGLVIIVGISEFFMKVTTNNVPEWNATVISIFVVAVFTQSLLFIKKIRKDFLFEIHNLKYCFISELLTFLSIVTIFFAMGKIKATIVSAISAIEPLFVIVIELIFNKYTGITKDRNFIKKLVPISLIVLGVVFISLCT